jgi:hypothetical protein
MVAEGKGPHRVPGGKYSYCRKGANVSQAYHHRTLTGGRFSGQSCGGRIEPGH